MAITRRTDYAIRILLELVNAGGATPLPATRIAELAGIPYEFARSISRALAVAGLLRSARGATGGFSLARPASEISVADILDATQEPPLLNTCVSDPDGCRRSGGCPMHPVWLDADAELHRFLTGMDIEAIARRLQAG